MAVQATLNIPLRAIPALPRLHETTELSQCEIHYCPPMYQPRAERLGRPPLVPFARAAAALAGEVARPACCAI